jgi:hypothetical protein
VATRDDSGGVGNVLACLPERGAPAGFGQSGSSLGQARPADLARPLVHSPLGLGRHLQRQ